MSKSKLSERRNRHDAYHQRAKKEGFAARAVYKLEEIDARYPLFRPGAAVLDLGCRPGSWLQYAARQVGPQRRAGRHRSRAARRGHPGRTHRRR
jgi:23S rRNA (uridine2552-2'-O)-methyltransferase